MRRIAGTAAARVLSALLVVIGAVGVAPRVIVTAVAPPACLTPWPVLGDIGLRLDVVTRSPHCPAGWYAPGASFSQVTLMVSASTILALVAWGMVALGGWASVASSLAELRQQVAAAIRTVLEPMATVVPGARPVPVPVRVRVGTTRAAGPRARRGPPSGCR